MWMVLSGVPSCPSSNSTYWSVRFQLIYDNSQLQEFKNCQYRYWLKYIHGYRKLNLGEESHDSNFGGAIHKALETHYKGGRWDDCKLAFTELYPDQLRASDKAKTQANGIRVLEAYYNRYREEDKRFKVLACEEQADFEIGEGVRYKVKIDLIVENLEQGGIYVMDHKTTGKSFDYRYWAQFEPNSQLTGYCAYALHRFGECSGAYINGIRLGYRERRYKDEPQGFHYDFQRQLFNRNQLQIANWKRDVIGWVKQVESVKLNEQYCKNTSQCQWCSFKPICLAEWDPMDANDRECIEIQYVQTDPYAYLGASNETPPV